MHITNRPFLEMKKNTLTVIAFISSIYAFGQTTFTNTNEPELSDSRNLFVCDSNATNLSFIVGNGVIWNYGSTDTYAGEMRLMEIVTPASTGYASDYPGSTKVVKIENFASTFMSSTSAERISQGYLFESPDFGTVKGKFTNDAENLMLYPFALNNQVIDIFSGNLSFAYQNIPQNPSCTGNSTVKYDGFGTLVQVNNIAVSNVSRIHIIDTTFASIPFIGNTNVIRDQYEYYDLTNSNKTPIFIHSHVKIEAGFPEPLLEIKLVLSAVPGNALAGIENKTNTSIKVFPNPAKNNFSISGISSEAQAVLIDLSGRRTVLNRINTNHYDVSDFAAGVYLLKITNQGKSSTQRLIVE